MNGTVILCEKSNKSKYEIVSAFYDLENDNFFKNIHKKSGTKKECIEDTCNSIADSSEIFEVFYQDELAAYFVKFTDDKAELALEGFHVKKQFRTAEFLKLFSELIKSKFDKEFCTGIYINNKPAIKFLTKMGMNIMNVVNFKEQSFFILKLDKCL